MTLVPSQVLFLRDTRELLSEAMYLFKALIQIAKIQTLLYSYQECIIIPSAACFLF